MSEITRVVVFKLTKIIDDEKCKPMSLEESTKSIKEWLENESEADDVSVEYAKDFIRDKE